MAVLFIAKQLIKSLYRTLEPALLESDLGPNPTVFICQMILTSTSPNFRAPHLLNEDDVLNSLRTMAINSSRAPIKHLMCTLPTDVGVH